MREKLAHRFVLDTLNKAKLAQFFPYKCFHLLFVFAKLHAGRE